MIRHPLLLALLLVAAPAHAGRWQHGPHADTLGISIKSWSTVNPDQYRSDEGLLPAGGAFQAYHVVDGRPDLLWICFGVFQGDSAVRWPAQRWPVLYADSLRIVPGQAFAVGAPPTMAPLPLALLEPDRMWRLRFQGNGDVATVVFAGYPRGAWRLDHVDRLRLERRTEGGSP